MKAKTRASVKSDLGHISRDENVESGVFVRMHGAFSHDAGDNQLWLCPIQVVVRVRKS